MPVLSATPAQLRDLHRKAHARDDLITVGFNEVARQARDYDDYLAAFAATPAEEIDYVAVAVFGPRNRVTALTKRFALYAPAGEPPGKRTDGKGRRAGLFPAADDRRFSTPATDDEQQVLLDMLRAQRTTLTLKCADVETELARGQCSRRLCRCWGWSGTSPMSSAAGSGGAGRSGRTSPVLVGDRPGRRLRRRGVQSGGHRGSVAGMAR